MSGYYVFNPFTKKMDWTEAGGGGPSFASIWTSQLSFGSATGGSMFASTVSFSSITTSHCTLNKNIYNYINLTMFPNVSFASAKVDVNADAMVLTDSTGYTIYSSTVGLTVTLSISGISGLMGSAEASSQWYHIWGISDGVNFTAIADSSPSTPTFPSGYTFKCYLGAVYNNSSGNIFYFKQTDNKATIVSTRVLSGGTATSWTGVSCATTIPSTAKLIFGSTEMDVANKVGYLGSINGYISLLFYTPSAIWAPYILPITTAQTIYYYVVSGQNMYVEICGWEY